MKKLTLAFVAVALTVAVAMGLRWQGSHEQTARAPEPTGKADAPTSALTDPVKVFERAFWATPTSEDKILHAERREWEGTEGVEKWQWFLVVEPSAALLKRLRDENVFGLKPEASASAIVEPPPWFTFNPGEVSVLKSPQGNLQLIFSKEGHRLFATDSGLGFRPGAGKTVKPLKSEPVPGPIPNTQPPRPRP